MGESDRPIRVLQALTTGEFGGTELMVSRLVTRLARCGVQCEVSVLDGSGPVFERLERSGIRVHRLRSAGAPTAFRRLLAILREGRFHILHLYGFRMSLLGRVAARFIRQRPVVIHGIRGLHVTEAEDVSGWRTRLAVAIERVAAPLVDLYVANSEGARAFLCGRGLPEEKFVTIPNGVDPDEWWSPARDDRRPGARPTVVCVGNFRARKRQRDLIHAMVLLRSRGVRTACALVGDGPLRGELEALVRELELHDVVRFLGRLSPEELPTVLHQADVFVLPSLWEGMPGSVLEAMAAGRPVVGTDVPGIRDVVVDGVTGFLVPPQSPEALASRIERLLADPVLRERMGVMGRERVVAEFSLDRMVARHADVYRRGAGGRGRPVTPGSVSG